VGDGIDEAVQLACRVVRRKARSDRARQRLAERLKIPVRFVGLGEALEDLREFDAREFVDALFATDDSGEQSASGSYAA